MQIRTVSLAALASVAIVACSEIPNAPSPGPSLDVVAASRPSRHVVVFSGHAVPDDFAARVEAAGGTVAARLANIGVVLVDGLTNDGAAALAAAHGVLAVERDEPVFMEQPVSFAPMDYTFDDPSEASPGAPWTAFAFAHPAGNIQWNMLAVNAEPAWRAGRLGSAQTRVAIIDSGIDPRHLDLAGRIDTQNSISFAEYEDDTVRTRLIDQKRIPSDHPRWADYRFHGTHVAATVASNAVRSAGVTSQVTLVAYKTNGWDGTGTFSDVFAAMYMASDLGVDVINMSLGAWFTKRNGVAKDPDTNEPLKDTMDPGANGPGVGYFFNRVFAYARRAGVTIVVAAGNDARDLDHDGNGYAAMCDTPHVICVAATGPVNSGPAAGVFSPFGPHLARDTQSSFTNYGTSAIDVSAPGGNFFCLATNPTNPNQCVRANQSFVYAACTTSSKIAGLTTCGPASLVGLQGTSMAAPHVAGLAALLAEQFPKQPSRIKHAILSTADPVFGDDNRMGAGRINVARALGLTQ